MKIAIHQPNFIPWFPFFYKMAHADIFVLMENCQFEKNGYQNRCKVRGKWWTIPVKGGLGLIKDKRYVNGERLTGLNYLWIVVIARTLEIDINKIRFDHVTNLRGTERIVQICEDHQATHYLTNPEAVEKYLDANLLTKAGIEIVPCSPPKQYHKHIFEMFEEYGIEGTSKILKEAPGWKTCGSSSAT